MASKGITKTKQYKKTQKKMQEAGFDDFDPPMFYDKGTGGTICDRIVLNNKLRVGVVLFLVAVVVPLLVYTYMFAERREDNELDMSDVWGTCYFKEEYRVPCLIGRKVDANLCGSIGCCWNKTMEQCHHSLPSKYQYLTENATNNNLSVILKPHTWHTPYRTSMATSLKCVIQPITDTHLQIRVTNLTQDAPSYNSSLDQKDTLFNISVSAEPGERFYTEIRRRRADGDEKEAAMLLSTARGPMQASQNFWEITLQLPKDGVTYGLGRLRLKTGVENPKVLHVNSNSTGSHPVFISVDAEGRTSGVYIRHGGPMDVHFYHESNFVVVRSLSNEGFDVNVFAGPTPQEVMNQLTDVLGRPKLPPYWALGLHVCRNSVGKAANVTTMMKDFGRFMDAAEAMELPYDSHCVHERLLHELTYDIADGGDVLAITAGLERLANSSRAFVTSLPSPVAVGTSAAYTSAVEAGILVRDGTENVEIEGEYEGVPVVYPDWSNPGSESWIAARIQGLRDKLGSIDGIVLQDNWPANYKKHDGNETFEYLPERLNGSLSNGTLWYEALHFNNIMHNEIHNDYSLLHSQRVFSTMDPSTNLLLSASTHSGGGQYSGSHHQSSTEVPAKWSSLKETLHSALGLGLSGIPLASGGSVCGSMTDFNHTIADHEALCLKWYLLSVTLPMIRVSSIPPYRDPTTFPSGFMRRAVVRALKFRYALLPYYYTLFSEAAMTGTPVARPMFFEFPRDNVTRYMDEQFMLGSAVMVAPVLQPGAINVQVYLPALAGQSIKWYHFIGGYPINNGTGGHFVIVSLLETEILMMLRSGYIVPIQDVNQTATTSRLLPHHVVIGLDCSTDPCSAQGDLYLDSPDQSSSTTILFSANSTSLTVTNLTAARDLLCNTTAHISTVIDGIAVYGLSEDAFQMSISSGIVPRDASVTYSKKNAVLRIDNLPFDWCKSEDDEVTISWS